MTAGARGHVKQLDGLRALAIGLVFVFHAAPDVLHGGYVGVDVFFVLSGYLITSLLVQEWSDTGRIDLRAFYSRRAVRLYPALLIALMLAVPLALWLNYSGLLGDELAGLTYTSDFWTLFHTPHVDALGQLWSLAVEEQFYLVWPFVIVRVLRRWGPASWKIVAASIIPLAILKATAYQTLGWQSAYFPPWGSTDALMVGAVIGLLLPVTRQQDSFVGHPSGGLLERTSIGAAALAVILLGAGGLHEIQDPRAYRGGLLVVALGAGILIPHVVLVSDRGIIGRFFGCPPAVWAGRRSYAIYLFHLGAVDLVSRLNASRSLRIVTALMISLALAEVSWQLVERPVARRLRPGIAARSEARASLRGF